MKFKGLDYSRSCLEMNNTSLTYKSAIHIKISLLAFNRVKSSPKEIIDVGCAHSLHTIGPSPNETHSIMY